MRAVRYNLFYCFAALGVAESYQLTRPSLKTSTSSNQNERLSRNIGDGVSVANQIYPLGIQYSAETIIASRTGRSSRLEMSSSSLGDGGDGDDSGTLVRFALFAGIGILYWYLLVLGAAAHANGLPVPDFIPMVPGWPVSDSDLAPVLEDSYHFFYLSDLLGNPDAPFVCPPRLAVFNLVEAWIFAMLPLLWRDGGRRLPRPILLVSWLALGINLTNAFLAPYLAITELRGGKNEDSSLSSSIETETKVQKNSVTAGLFAAIALAVVGHAVSESVTVATATDWADFAQLAKTDRSYLAFCVDPVLFAIFQPLMLARIKNESDLRDYVPFVGLILWLLLDEKEE